MNRIINVSCQREESPGFVKGDYTHSVKNVRLEKPSRLVACEFLFIDTEMILQWLTIFYNQEWTLSPISASMSTNSCPSLTISPLTQPTARTTPSTSALNTVSVFILSSTTTDWP